MRKITFTTSTSPSFLLLLLFISTVNSLALPSLSSVPLLSLSNLPSSSWISLPKLNIFKRAPLPLPLTSPRISIPINNHLPSLSDLPTTDALRNTWEVALKTLALRARELLSDEEGVGSEGRVEGVPGTGITSDKEKKELQEELDCWTGSGEWVFDSKAGRKGADLRNDQTESEREGNSLLTVHKQESIFASCDKGYYKGRIPGGSQGAGKNEKDWDVRESLKWRWLPSTTCRPLSSPSKLSRILLCKYLAHKSTLIVGATPDFTFHDLLLDWTSFKPQSCYGDLYCKEHALCSALLREGVGGWGEDEKVYAELPHERGSRPSKSGKAQVWKRSPLDIDTPELANSNHQNLSKRAGYTSPSSSTLLRYRRSDGLVSSMTRTVPQFIHPSTGILEINQQWIADSHRSDVIIVSKAPLPLPMRGINETWDQWQDEGDLEGEEGVKILEAAILITKEVWLPELIATLRSIRSTAKSSKETSRGWRDQLVVYRGGWRSHSDCGMSGSDKQRAVGDMSWSSPGDGPAPHLLQPSLRKIFFPSSTCSKTTASPHILFFNLQTILQNHILRHHILPSFGIPYLDFESSLSVWRSGMIGGSSSRPSNFLSSSPSLQDQTSHSHLHLNMGMRKPTSGDCSRYCIPSPGGGGVERIFIGGLIKIFERGWGGEGSGDVDLQRERERNWVGEGFVSVKERGKFV